MARKPIAALIVPSMGAYPVVTDVIQNGMNSIRSNGAVPMVVIVHDSPLPPAIVNAIKKINGDIRFLPVSTRGMGNAVMAGFDYAAKHSDTMTMLPDDYEIEARDVYKTLKPILRNTADVSSGAWPYETFSASSFPRPQYINETAVSRLTTYVNPHVKAGKGFVSALLSAEKEGKYIQAYHGVHSIRSKYWGQCKKDIHHLFAGQMNLVGRWSVDVAMVLAAYYRGKKVRTPTAIRTFEHAQPAPETLPVIRQKRIDNFVDAMPLFRVFLEKTGQTEKVPVMERVVEQTVRRIQHSAGKTPSAVWARLERMRKVPGFKEQFPALGKHAPPRFAKRFKGRKMN